MTKNELNAMAIDTAHLVIANNLGNISKEVEARFNASEEDRRIELHDALGRIVNLMLDVIPEISASVTAQMLVNLNLVSLDDD